MSIARSRDTMGMSYGKPLSLLSCSLPNTSVENRDKKGGEKDNYEIQPNAGLPQENPWLKINSTVAKSSCSPSYPGHQLLSFCPSLCHNPQKRSDETTIDRRQQQGRAPKASSSWAESNFPLDLNS